MSKQHTPGPWCVSTNPGGVDDQPAFPSVRDSDGNEIIALPLGDSETVKANARLIAAAPELLEALKQCARDMGVLVFRGDIAFDDKPRSTKTRDAALAAIAKAEGRTP